MNSRQRTIPWPHPAIAIIVIALTVLLLYFQALPGPFILDDYGSIVDNPHIRMRALTPAEAAETLKSPSANRPLANLSFALNYYVHGYDAAGYRIVNLVLHVITGWLVFLIGRLTPGLSEGRSRFIPAAAALLWLSSPLHTQSVTYIVQRMSLLAALFYLLALLCYIQTRQRQLRGDGFSRPILLLTAGLLAGGLALVSKETAATLPLMILIYEWLFFQNGSMAWLRRQLPWLIVILLTVLILALLYLGEAPLARIRTGYEKQSFTMGQRLLTQPMVIIYYISLLLFPHPARLNLDYDFPVALAGSGPIVAGMALAALAALAAAALIVRKNRLVVFAVFWFLTTLAVESSFLGLALVFEHRLYLPTVFPVIALTAGLTGLVRPRTAVAALLASAIVLSGLGTIERNRAWQSKVDLWRNTAAKSPLLPRPWHNLGLALDRAGDLNEAVAAFLQALALAENPEGRHRLAPDHPEVINIYNNLGLTYMKQQNWPEAVDCFREVLERGAAGQAPGHIPRSDTFSNLGRACLKIDDLDRALNSYQQGLAVERAVSGPDSPRTAMIYNNLGVVYQAMNDFGRAAAYYRRAAAVFHRTLGPDHPLTRSARKNLQNVSDPPSATGKVGATAKPGATNAAEPSPKP